MRWTPKTKAAAIAKIDAGTLDPVSAGISAEELASWRFKVASNGLRGLKVNIERESTTRPWYVA